VENVVCSGVRCACGGFWIGFAFGLDFRGGGCVMFPPKFPPSSIFPPTFVLPMHIFAAHNIMGKLLKQAHFIRFSLRLPHFTFFAVETPRIFGKNKKAVETLRFKTNFQKSVGAPKNDCLIPNTG
jgi:hypothetical protein